MPTPGIVLAAVSAAEADACGDGASAACLFVYRRTENEVLARAADWLIAKPLKIVLILVVAFVAGRIVRRVIDEFVGGVTKASLSREPSAGDAASFVLTGPLGVRARQRAETLAAVLRSLARGVIFIIAGLTILGELDINLGPLLAGAGIAGVALGFGAQTLVRDFLSGVFMLIEDQFGVGDFIDVGGVSGEVEGLSLRTTRLRDVDGTVWHVPNGEIKRVGNMSQDWSRAVVDVQVAHGTDLSRATEVVKEAADAMWQDPQWSAQILMEPEVWGVQGVTATGITIRLVLKTRPAVQWGVQRALRQRMIDAFQAAGIEVPVIHTVTAAPAVGDP